MEVAQEFDDLNVILPLIQPVQPGDILFAVARVSGIAQGMKLAGISENSFFLISTTRLAYVAIQRVRKGLHRIYPLLRQGDGKPECFKINCNTHSDIPVFPGQKQPIAGLRRQRGQNLVLTGICP